MDILKIIEGVFVLAIALYMIREARLLRKERKKLEGWFGNHFKPPA